MKTIQVIHSTPPAGLEIDPVCGMTVDPKQAAASYQYAGRTYYFCNQSCLDQFNADPEQYLKPAQVVGSHIDPVCGMTVDPTTAAGHYDYQGNKYYFCAVSCLDKFKADPERFLNAVSAGLISLEKKKPLPMMMPV